MGGGVTERLERIIGREAEVSALRQFVAAEPTAGTVVLAGVPGIGKTTLWQEGIDSARDRGLRVLVSRPSGAEAQHSFAGLIDLCDGLEEHALAVLPAPQRAALEVALLRSEPGGQPPGAQAIALGFLGVLRVLSANAPLLVAVDDLQWLDGPSNDLLAFAARRLEREPVAFLLAKRPLAPSQLERALERRSVHRLDVGPLSFGATRRLLAARLKLSLSRDLLRRVVDVTLGNPLFVIELGRAFIEQGIPEGRDDIPLPGGIEDLLGMRIAALAPDVRRLLVAVALSADLRAAEAVAVAGVQALERAIDAGVIDVVGDRVRPSHPLVTAAAKSAAPRGEQRELHLALAGAVADDELRAMHLAFATEHTDGELADTVERAARAAFARGARQQAVQLAEHALRLTPPRSPARPERLLVLARYLEVAGEIQRVTDLLTPHLASLPSGAPRARAWLMLSEGAGPRHLDDLRRYRERALAECDNDPLLRALVLAKNASNAAGSTITGLERAGDAVALATIGALQQPAAQLALLPARKPGDLPGIVGALLDQRERLQHRVVQVRRQLRALLLADARRALERQAAAQPHEPRHGQQAEHRGDDRDHADRLAQVALHAHQVQQPGRRERHQQHAEHESRRVDPEGAAQLPAERRSPLPGRTFGGGDRAPHERQPAHAQHQRPQRVAVAHP